MSHTTNPEALDDLMSLIEDYTRSRIIAAICEARGENRIVYDQETEKADSLQEEIRNKLASLTG